MMMMMMKKRQKTKNSVMKSIPVDVIFDIFKRLPVKSLMRFRCISKLCSTVIADPHFAKVHQPCPATEPGLLITCPAQLQSAQMFFTTDLNGGSAIHHITIPPRFARYTTHSLNGLVCMDFGLCATICNPSTSQAITLPFICPTTSPSAATSNNFCVNSFGFDHVTKQYKVLNSWLVAREVPGHEYLHFMEYRVFTLGTNSWRLLDGGPICYPQRESVCVNGIIYFRAWVSPTQTHKVIMVAFNVHSESLDVIELPEDAPRHADTSQLIQYLGHLAIVKFIHNYDYNKELSFWILEDDERWAKETIILSFDWNEIHENDNYYMVGILNTKEYIEYVFAPRSLSKPFYVFYYNLEECSWRRVEISGLPEYHLFDLSCNTAAVTFYEENVMSLT